MAGGDSPNFISSGSRILWFVIRLIFCLFCFFLLDSCSRNFSRNNYKILLIGLDGASLDIVYRLASENRIPNIQRLIEQGSTGYLDSIKWKKRYSSERGLFSPIIWASIVTGKFPSKHGIEDFTLPLPSNTNFQMGSDSEGVRSSVLSFPFHSSDRMSIRFRAKAPAGLDEIQLEVDFNGAHIGSCSLAKEFTEYTFPVGKEKKQWIENRITFHFDRVQPVKASFVGADVDFIRVLSSNGQELLDYFPTNETDLFGDGWLYRKPKSMTLAGSFHFRTRTLWEILSHQNKRIGVVGWWETWPAFKINGHMASSYLGVHGEQNRNQNSVDLYEDLTYPPELLNEIRPLYESRDKLVPEFEDRFFELEKCACIGSTQEKIILSRFWQDKFFGNIAKYMIQKNDNYDLFAVYFRGTDTVCHQFLGYSEHPEVLEEECGGKPGCDLERIRRIVDNYYTFVDSLIGDLLKTRDSNTITFIVADHGEFAEGRAGNHRNNGIVLLQGPGIRPHAITRASVLDVTPTILYLMGLPLGQDMDGNVIKEALEENILQKAPVSFITSYDRIVQPGSPGIKSLNPELQKEEEEELKALGYIN